MTYETVWSGATWRSFAPPIVGAPPDGSLDDVHVLKGQERVYQQLTDDWQDVQELQRAALMPRRYISKFLGRLIAAGRVEFIEAKRGDGGGSGRLKYLYRKRQGV